MGQISMLDMASGRNTLFQQVSIPPSGAPAGQIDRDQSNCMFYVRAPTHGEWTRGEYVNSTASPVIIVVTWKSENNDQWPWQCANSDQLVPPLRRNGHSGHVYVPSTLCSLSPMFPRRASSPLSNCLGTLRLGLGVELGPGIV